MTNTTPGSRVDDHVERSLGFLSLGSGDDEREDAVRGEVSTTTNSSNDLYEHRPGSSHSATTRTKAEVGTGNDQEDDEARHLLILYKWLDSLPLPSIKRSSGIVARDFSDGTAVADIIHYYFPTYVEQHNYVKTSNSARKKTNWEVLMSKVLLKREPFKGAFAGLASRRAREADIAVLSAGVMGSDGRNTALEGFLWKLMRCCLDHRDVSSVGGRGDGVRRVAPGRAVEMHQDRSGESAQEMQDIEGSEEGESESETDASMLQTLIDENKKLSNMVVKQDGIIRLMQAKIDALERELGL